MFGRNDELLSMDKYHSQSGAKSTRTIWVGAITDAISDLFYLVLIISLLSWAAGR